MSKPPDWIKQTNIYEVNLRQYSEAGTFSAFALHLPRLKDMEIKTLWFMPITPISEKNKKGSMGSYYACSDYTSVNPEFGTLEEFKKLVELAHDLEFKIIIDWVANHTGWDHKWTVEHPDWYEKDEASGDFKRASGMDDIIELDYKRLPMRQAMIEAMKFWVTQCAIDGFRCDLAAWVEVDFWLEAIPEVNKLKPLLWLAEADPYDNPEYMQVFDAAYSWIWMHKTEDFYKKKLSFPDLVRILDNYGTVPGLRAWFTSNHDENTWNGSEYEKYGDLAKTLAVFSCTWPGIPLIYSGQEMPNLKRLAFFERGPIEWKDQYGLHYFYRTLLKLQTTHPALDNFGKVERLQTSAQDRVLAYKRKKDQAEILVILNFSGDDLKVQMINELQGKYQNIFTGVFQDFGITKTVDLLSWDFRVYKK
ncbi:MAG: alpha-amylase family glycosyl hydrolase [Flavisolibacter sp.]